MQLLEFKGEISTPMIGANNSNVDPNIEIVKVNINKTSLTTEVKILKDPSNYFNHNLLKLLDEEVYMKEKDRNGIPFINHFEKYPELDKDIFIPIEYNELNKDKYFINKNGTILSKESGILKGTISSYGYLQQCLTDTNNRIKTYTTHRLIATTFIFNPKPEIYKVVNHINSNREDCSVNNLEWITDSGNSMKKKSFERKSQDLGKLIGYSGNLEDYIWEEHWKYPGLFVSKEEFIRYGSKIAGSLNSSGYIFVSIKAANCNTYAHRIIMEFLLKRNLKTEEFIDHINTITYDNSFTNLRVSDQKGNMRNELTIKKRYKQIVLSNLFGDFVRYDTVKNIQSDLTNKDIKRNNLRSSVNIIKHTFLSNKYIAIYPQDRKTLLKKMEKVIYVFNKNKTELLGAFTDCVSAAKEFGLSTDSVWRSTKKNKIALDSNYYLRGPEAVKLVISLGHGTAANFKPEEEK